MIGLARELYFQYHSLKESAEKEFIKGRHITAMYLNHKADLMKPTINKLMMEEIKEEFEKYKKNVQRS